MSLSPGEKETLKKLRLIRYTNDKNQEQDGYYDIKENKDKYSLAAQRAIEYYSPNVQFDNLLKAAENQIKSDLINNDERFRGYIRLRLNIEVILEADPQLEIAANLFAKYVTWHEFKRMYNISEKNKISTERGNG